MEEKNPLEANQNEADAQLNSSPSQSQQLQGQEAAAKLTELVNILAKNYETQEFMFRSIKESEQELKKQNVFFMEQDFKEKMNSVEEQMKMLSKDGLDGIKSISDNVVLLKEELLKNDQEKLSNVKEVIIRLDAVIETISIFQESNEHIKSLKDHLFEQLTAMESKFDAVNGAIEKFSGEVTAKMEEQTKAFTDVIERMVKQNEGMTSKFDSFFTGFEKMTSSIQEIAEFEKNMNSKREKEFAISQAKMYNDRGTVLFYRGIFSAALDYFKKALELNGESAEICNNIGQTYIKTKNFDKAEEYLRKAIELMPDFSECYNNLGLMYLDNANYDLAIENFGKALNIYPEFSDAYFNTGNVFHKMNKIDDAIKNWEKALEINPFNEQAKEKIKIFKKGEIDE